MAATEKQILLSVILSCCLCLFHPSAFSETSITRATSDNAIAITVSSNKGNEESTTENLEDSKTTDREKKIQEALLRIYRSSLLKKTYQHIIYPDSAIDQSIEGDIVIVVRVDRAGKVLALRYITKSSHRPLNTAARRAITNAQPYPAAPTKLKGDTFEVEMPIKFRLAD